MGARTERTLGRSVLDLLGRTMLALHPAGTTAQVDLSGLPAGSYLVQAQSAAGTSTRKLIVE